MSDFDKEAEREKLRKKYERDKRDREATQRMSDLLLKGATMTNTHCDTCADPLFRQNGVTFCPSCHGSPEAVEGPDLEDDGAAGVDEGEDSADAPSSTEEAEVDEADAGGDAVDDRADDQRPADEPTAAEAEEQAAARPTDERVARHASAPPSDTPTGGDRRSRQRAGRRSSASPSGDADLETARTSLTAALEYFAREAAETDDPRYARDCLEAAREAAETLAVLGR